MDNFIQNYELILCELQKMEINFSIIRQIRKPKLNSLGIITNGNYSSECQLFRVISGNYLENKIERSVYNRRRRKLFDFIELVR